MIEKLEIGMIVRVGFYNGEKGVVLDVGENGLVKVLMLSGDEVIVFDWELIDRETERKLR